MDDRYLHLFVCICDSYVCAILCFHVLCILRFSCRKHQQKYDVSAGLFSMSLGRITPVKKRAVREADGSIRFLNDDEHVGDFKGSFTEPPRKSPSAFKNPGHHLEDRVKNILHWEGFKKIEINRLVRDGHGTLL